MTSKLVVNTIEADTGISSVSFASSISMSSTSKFHFSAAGIDIDADTNINRPAAGVIGFNINGGEKVRITSEGALQIGNLQTSQNSTTHTSATKLHIDSTKSIKIARLAAGNITSAGWFTVAKVAASNGNYFKCYASIGGDFTGDMCVMELTGSFSASGALQNTYAEPVFKAYRTGSHSTDRITRARLVKDGSNLLYLQIYIAGGVNNNTWGKSVLEYQIGAYSQNSADSGSDAMFAAGGSVTNIRTLEVDDNAICVSSGSHKFYSGGNATERVTINANGQVIAGHTSTFGSSKLSVIGDSTVALVDNAENFTRANDAFALIYNKNTGNVESGLTILSSGSAGSVYNMYVKKTGSYAGDLIFRSRTGVSSSAERLRITSGGLLQLNNDSAKIQLGASQDLQIYHDGSSNRIIAANAGFILQSQDYSIRSENGSTTYATIDSSGQFALGRTNQITGNGNSSTSVFEQLSNSNYPLALHSSQTNKRGLMIFYATTGAGNAGDPFIVCTDNTNNKFQVTSDGTITNRGHILPAVNNDKDLGSSSLRWRNVYTTDLQLSNKGKTNDVDNTWGDYTIQEGESDLFLINNRNGKKYKFNLTEVS